MKTIKEIILRTLSIIRTHLCIFSNYRNYSIRLQYKNYKGWQNKNYDITQMNDILSLIFDDNKTNSIQKTTKIIKKTGNIRDKKVHYIINSNNINFYIKIFNNSNIILILKDIFRASKAKKFYVSNFEIKKRNILVPEAVFFVQKKFFIFKTSSFIATREITDTKPFTQHYKDWTPNHTDSEKKHYLKELANFIYLLNNKKVAHADLLGNILIKEKNNKILFFLIDNDAVKLFNNLTKFDFIKHFEGFYDFFVKKEAYSKDDWKILCKEYINIDNTISNSIETLTEYVKNRKNLLFYVTSNK